MEREIGRLKDKESGRFTIDLVIIRWCVLTSLSIVYILHDYSSMKKLLLATIHVPNDDESQGRTTRGGYTRYYSSTLHK
jgi:hypothetical protein